MYKVFYETKSKDFEAVVPSNPDDSDDGLDMDDSTVDADNIPRTSYPIAAEIYESDIAGDDKNESRLSQELEELNLLKNPVF